MHILKNTLVSLAVLMITMSCKQQPEDKPVAEKTEKADETYAGPLDLSTLQLRENIVQLMASQGIKPEKSAEPDETLYGMETFKSSDPKAMHFGGTDFSGKAGKDKNYVLFHYKDDSKKLVMFELTVYDKAQTNALVSQLEKLNGKTTFEQVGHKKGSQTLDENGNMIPWKDGDIYAFRVWDNKKTGITYFLVCDGLKEQITTRLIALKRSEQAGKDWIKLNSLDWYERS